MKIFGLAGWSGSGKTTLTSRLLPELIGRGLTVSTVKHAHHSFDIDQPGKDSYVHRMAGASEVLVASANRWALMHEHRGTPEPGAAELIRHMTPVDLLLIEGFKREPHPKLEVYRHFAVHGRRPDVGASAARRRRSEATRHWRIQGQFRDDQDVVPDESGQLAALRRRERRCC